MPPAQVPAELTAGPFTLAEAIRHGLTPRMLQSRPWRQLLRGVYAHVDVEVTRRLMADAATLAMPAHAFFCGITAAWVWGVDVARDWTAPESTLHVGYPPGTNLRERRHRKRHRVSVSADEIVVRAGIRVTSALRTAFDCSRWCDQTDAVVVVDSLANRRLITFAQLTAYNQSRLSRHGSPRLARVLVSADAGAESPMETRTRLICCETGLEVMSQYNVFDGPRFVGRLDLADLTLRIAVEYDGAQHWDERQADDRRRDRLRALGWIVIVVGWSDIHLDSGAALRQRIWTAVRQRAA